MADENTLQFTDTHSMGHFVYYSFSLCTGELVIVDSLSNSFESSPYLDHETAKKFFSRLYTLYGGSSRSMRPIKYQSNAFRQKRVECGYNGLINLILSLKYSGDLTKFKFSSYNTTIMNFKTFLCQLLITKNIPFNLVKTYWIHGNTNAYSNFAKYDII